MTARYPLDRRGVTLGMAAVAVVVAVTFVGSEGLVWFDPALVGYLFGTIFAVFGVVYRYTVWLRRPPTAMLNRRGWDAFRARRARNLAALPSLVASQLLVQGFIRRRSRRRWLAHQLVFWGCLLAAAVPLGMYGAATYRMADAIQLDTIDWLPKVTLAVALAAWTATAAGLAHTGARSLTQRPASAD